MVAAWWPNRSTEGQALCRFSHVKTLRYLRPPTRQVGTFLSFLWKRPRGCRWVRHTLQTCPKRLAPQQTLSAVTNVAGAISVTADAERARERTGCRSCGGSFAFSAAGVPSSPHKGDVMPQTRHV